MTTAAALGAAVGDDLHAAWLIWLLAAAVLTIAVTAALQATRRRLTSA